MSDKKYAIIFEDRVVFKGRPLYRIKALKDFGMVKAGDLGGYIQSEANLSHEGDCWVHDDAKVYHNAKVYGNATVYNTSLIYGSAHVFGNAVVSEDAQVYDNAAVYDNALVYNGAQVSGNTEVSGDMEVGATTPQNNTGASSQTYSPPTNTQPQPSNNQSSSFGDKKYILTDECIMLKDEDENGNTFYRTLYRIKAVKDFDIALSGHLGGFIESESNLSQWGRCWVGGNAKVYGSAQVVDDALVTDLAQVI